MKRKKTIIDPNLIEPGQKCWLYDDRARWDVCYATILHVLPHPEDPNDRLIVYRWYGEIKQWWWYGVTSASYQELYLDLTVKKVRHNYFNNEQQ